MAALEASGRRAGGPATPTGRRGQKTRTPQQGGGRQQAQRLGARPSLAALSGPASASAAPGLGQGASAPAMVAVCLSPLGVSSPGATGGAGATGDAVVLRGLAAELVLAIASHAREVEGYAKGALELHWGPNGVHGRMHPLWEEAVGAELLGRFTRPALPSAPTARTATPPPLAATTGRQRGARRQPSAVTMLETAIIVGTEEVPWERERGGE